MNTLKTVVVTVILMAVGYGVYVSVWKPEKSASDKTATTVALPAVQMPGQDLANNFSPGTTTGGGRHTVAQSPGTLNSQVPLFVSTTRSPNAGGSPGLASPGFSNDSVTVIPGPNTESAPATPSMPAPGMMANPGQPLPSSTATPVDASAEIAAQNEFRDKYKSFVGQVQKILDGGKLPEALKALTQFYELPNLPEPQRREVEQLLDQLAGTVIYSRQHYLERPHVVQQGDTLEQIADRYGVPSLLLARINGLDLQQPLPPNQELKVLRGPFTAIVNLDRHELMLKLEGGYYAGRFAIGVGADCPKLEGTYTVLEKTPRPIYRGPDGMCYAADDGRNPLGKYWIGLSDRIGLHGTIDETGIGRDDNRGTLCLKERDIDDLFGILSIGSKVEIRRGNEPIEQANRIGLPCL